MMRKGFLLSKKERAENKKQTQYRQHQKENWTPADRIKAFQKSIEWGWSFGCSSCHRLIYREQVNDLKPRDQQHLMNMMKITSLKLRHEGESKLICKTCHPYLKEFIKTEEQLDKMKEGRAENAPKLMLWIKEHGSIPGNWKICDHFDPPHNGDFGICEHTRTIQAEFEEFVQQETVDGQDSEEEESDTALEKSMDETQYLIKVLESESGCLCADEFMCSTCFEKFPSRHLLKSHERIHTGEQGHVCDDCGVSFGSKQALEHHMSKHNGQYNFVCPHCKKGYNCKTVFYEHTLTHSGDKPYT